MKKWKGGGEGAVFSLGKAQCRRPTMYMSVVYSSTKRYEYENSNCAAPCWVFEACRTLGSKNPSRVIVVSADAAVGRG